MNRHRALELGVLMPYNDSIQTNPMKLLKLFQYDKKVWDDGDIEYTWQFGIIKNRSFLWVNYENPGRIIHSSGGLNILFSFFSGCLFSVDIQQRRFCLAVGFFTEYVEGWDN